MSLERQAKIRRFAKQEDALRSLIGELLVRQVIRRYQQIPCGSINFKQNAFGKPSLLTDPNFHFNISHSGDWVICAISEDDLGIDIEKILPIDLQIARNYFTEEEIKYIFSVDACNEQKLHRFYEIWTLKESFIKAIGSGLSLSLKAFSVINDADEIKYSLQMDAKPNKYYLQQFELDPLYKCAVCGERTIESITVMDAESFFMSYYY